MYEAVLLGLCLATMGLGLHEHGLPFVLIGGVMFLLLSGLMIFG